MSVKRLWLTALAVTASMTTLITPALARADYNVSGVSSKIPWSGYWWPMLDTDATLYENGGALQKYDEYVRRDAGQRGRQRSAVRGAALLDERSRQQLVGVTVTRGQRPRS